MLGRYLDALPDEARDRVITAQLWMVAEWATSARRDGPRCLLGHSEDWPGDYLLTKAGDPATAAIGEELGLRFGPYGSGGIAFRFDRIANRISLDRAVHLVKQRAGKRTRIDVGEPEPATATTHPE